MINSNIMNLNAYIDRALYRVYFNIHYPIGATGRLGRFYFNTSDEKTEATVRTSIQTCVSWLYISSFLPYHVGTKEQNSLYELPAESALLLGWGV